MSGPDLKPVQFPHAVVSLDAPEGLTDEECGQLPIFRDEVNRTTISCWRLTLRQVLTLLIRRRLWVGVMYGGTTQPPIWLTVRSPFEEDSRG